MSRMTMTVDDVLLAEAQQALGVATKVEAVRRALQEAVRRRKLAEALSHRGSIELDLDSQTLDLLRAEG